MEFSRIIESKWINEKGKSNSNWKIAKAIANALRIQIDFNHFSKAKTIVLIPVQMDKYMELIDDKSRASKYMVTQGSDAGKGFAGLNFGKGKKKRDLDEINKDLSESVGLDTEQSALVGKKKGGAKKA